MRHTASITRVFQRLEMTTSKLDPVQWADEGLATLGFVGVTKNTGKTTALNAVAAKLRRADKKLGLISSGLDGEARDYLMEIEKPSVQVEPTDIVITATRAIEKSTAELSVQLSLGFESPLGEVVAASVDKAGDVVLAGMRHRSDLRTGLDILTEQFETDVRLVDGACGRQTNADGKLVDGLIISTGGVVSTDVSVVVTRTTQLCSQLTTETPPTQWLSDVIEHSVSEAHPVMATDRDIYACDTSSALLGIDELAETWDKSSFQCMAIPGVISDTIGETLANLETDAKSALLVRDGTSLQLSPDLEETLRANWNIYAKETAPILAITVNPLTFGDEQIDRDELVNELQHEYPEIPIVDVLGGDVGSG